MEESYDFELTSMITDEVSCFLDDIGLSPNEYALSISQDATTRKYSYVVLLRTSEIEDVIDAFVTDRDEFADHLKSQFPEADVALTLRGDDWDAEIIVDDEDDNFVECCGSDDDDASIIDSAERQYEEEGLTIIDEDEDEDEAYNIEELDDDECEDEELYDGVEQFDDSFDPYTPSADDMEDLWSTFGARDDDY